MRYVALTNHELHVLCSQKAADERKLTAEVIELLEEVARRKYFLELGYSSLFEYCTKELKYSEASAYRRIAAMRLLQDLPEVKERIEEGTLTLSNAATLQSFFKAEQKENAKTYSVEEKRDLLDALESKSKDEAQRVLAEVSPVLVMPEERSRALDADRTEIRFVADKELLEKLEKLKSLLSHKAVELNYQKLFHELAVIALKKLDPLAKNFAAIKRCSTKVASCTITRHIPAVTRRETWKKDGAKCSFVSPLTGKRCDSEHQLEIDHIKPFAVGGTHAPENLRVLCRAHNQHRAQKSFG